MTDDLKTLLTDLVDDQPAPGLDLDRQIARGRRRVRRRNALAGAGTAALIAGVVAGGLALGPGATTAELPVASAPSPLATFTPCIDIDVTPSEDHCGGAETTRFADSTAASTALATQVRALAPELVSSAEYTGFDAQGKSAGRLVPEVWAGFEVAVADQPDPAQMFRVKVARAGRQLDAICTGMALDAGRTCPATRHVLPDGTVAQVYRYTDGGKERRAVRIVRDDGTQVVIESGMLVRPEIRPVPDLSIDRMLEIAQGITVTP